jgi:ferredoxin
MAFCMFLPAEDGSVVSDVFFWSVSMPAQVDKDKCNACKSCVDSCPSNAITVPDDVAVVSKDDCIDCGACVDACPSSAISMAD